MSAIHHIMGSSYKTGLLKEYGGNLIVHLSGLYGTAPDSWTSLDNRYVFRKFNSSQSDLTWDKCKWKLRNDNVGLYADVLSEDKISTDMTIEVVMGNYDAAASNTHDNGIVFALDSDGSLNGDMYGHCKGLRSPETIGLIASYIGYAQDGPNPGILAFQNVKTIAFTRGEFTKTRVSFIIDGVLVPSTLSANITQNPKIPKMFAVGGTPPGVESGWNYGLVADIYAVRFHYGVIPVEQLAANHLLDKKIYG